MGDDGLIYRKHYDEGKAEEYRTSKEFRNRRTHEAEVRLVERALAGVDRKESIVDAPCGAGRMTVVLARLGFSPAAADVSPAMTERARERLRAEGLDVQPEVQDLEQTTWEDGAFDNLFSFRFFHHLPTEELRRKVAAEMCRVARKRTLVSYLDARSWIARRRALQSKLRGRRVGKHVNTPAEMRALFTQQGFAVVADYARMPFFHSLRLLVAEKTST